METTTNIEATENVVEGIAEGVVETAAKSKGNGLGVIVGFISGVALSIGGYLGYKHIKSKKNVALCNDIDACGQTCDCAVPEDDQ